MDSGHSFVNSLNNVKKMHYWFLMASLTFDSTKKDAFMKNACVFVDHLQK